MKAVVRLIAVVSFCALSAAAAQGVDDKGLEAMEGRPPAPEFELQGPGGERIRLSDYRGQPLIVNFWATWCPPCRAEMPSMQRAWEEIRDEGIGLIAINVGDSAGAVRQFAEEYPVDFPLPMDLDSSVVQAWPVRGLPTTFVVSPDGQIVYQAAGEREWDSPELLDQVRALKDAD